MTTDWWSVASNDESKGSASAATAAPAPIPEPADVAPIPERPIAPPRAEEPEQPEPAPSSNSGRGKAVKVVGIAAGAVIAGILVAHGISGGGGDSMPPTPATASQQEDLPAAGGGPEDALPAAGGGQPSAQPEPQSQSPAPKVVTLNAVPSGKGRVGAMVNVTIHNGTDEPVTVLATMMKGDGRPAIVGEGTLAPGSRTVQPGETATGTVEFSTAVAPHQVALLDLSGNVIAASN